MLTSRSRYSVLRFPLVFVAVSRFLRSTLAPRFNSFKRILNHFRPCTTKRSDSISIISYFSPDHKKLIESNAVGPMLRFHFDFMTADNHFSSSPCTQRPK